MATLRGRTPAAAADAGLAQVGDELIDVGGPVGAAGELSHLREARGCESVVLGAGLDQLVLDETLVDWQHRERVDLLVHLHQLAPRVVAVESERVCEVAAVLRAGADDRVDVVIENGEPLGVPAQGEPLVGVGGGPTAFLGRTRPEACPDIIEGLAVRRHARHAESRGVGDGVELEVFRVAVELRTSPSSRSTCRSGRERRPPPSDGVPRVGGTRRR